MATKWTFESGVSAIGSSALAAATTGTVTPNAGDLMVVSSRNITTITGNGTATIADSSVGGASWTAMAGPYSETAKTHGQGWWKIANAADYNSGSGITVAVTWSGGTGTNTTEVECDIFRVPAGNTVIGIDLNAVGGTSASATTTTATGVVGSSYPSNTDALAWTALIMGTTSSNGGITGTNTFTGTSSAANLALCVTTADTLLTNQYVGGVQGNTTGSSNVWKNTWTSSRASTLLIGATFVYQSNNTAGILPILNEV